METPPRENPPPRVQINWRVPNGKKPAGVVVCARPSAYGNPFRVGQPGIPTAAAAVKWFKEMLARAMKGTPWPASPTGATFDEATLRHFERMANKLPLLRGTAGLACYCQPSEPCHVDAIREILRGTP